MDDRLREIIQQIIDDMARLAEAVESTQRAVAELTARMDQKVETVEATQRFLAGQFRRRDGTSYGIGRQMPPGKGEEE